jgi:hypothetical protein
MILSGSSNNVKRVQREAARAQGRNVWNTGYLGSRLGGAVPDSLDVLYPDAFLVEQGPADVLPPHFHRADEFQVVLSGWGTLGNHPVQPPSVHFAGAFTPYGPIVAGPEGIGYMTLRKHYDTGALTMPKALPELRAAGREPRQLVSELLDIAPAVRQLECREVFEPEADGLAAWHYRLPAHTSVLGPDPAAGGGQYFLVLAGEMLAADGTSLPPKSCSFVSADEPAYRVASSASSALDVLVVQFAAS